MRRSAHSLARIRVEGGALARVPLLVLATAALAAAMLVPALHAGARGAWGEAAVFGRWAVIGAVFALVVGLATMRARRGPPARDQLVALAGIYALLPLLALRPVADLVPEARLGDLYLEFTAAVTTTGGTLFEPQALSPTVHLWRATVAWFGGLVVWVAAVAILAPLRLGGFEVVGAPDDGPDMADRIDPAASAARAARLSAPVPAADPTGRIARYLRVLLPVYAGLTAALALALAALGQPPTEAAIWAMSTLSTSGITGGEAPPTRLGEAVVMAFLVFAVSRHTFAADLHRSVFERLVEDRELRMAAALVLILTAVLFARHWIGSLELRTPVESLTAAGRAIWGALFTMLSFLTTAGFESADWPTARAWSGLDTPAVLLVGLVMVGGGVATTAGGVKLLRVYALYAHGRREMALLVHPHSVGAHVPAATRLRGKGVEAAWVFLMLFVLSLAVTTLALGAAGLDFRAALVLATATLSLCGPLTGVALEGGTAALGDVAKAILATAMVVGRLETLALIALFNPAFWRR